MWLQQKVTKIMIKWVDVFCTKVTELTCRDFKVTTNKNV